MRVNSSLVSQVILARIVCTCMYHTDAINTHVQYMYKLHLSFIKISASNLRYNLFTHLELYHLNLHKNIINNCIEQ